MFAINKKIRWINETAVLQAVCAAPVIAGLVTEGTTIAEFESQVEKFASLGATIRRLED